MTALDPNITTAELMAIDYKFRYSESELLEDWQRLCRTRKYKSGSQFKPGLKLCQHFCDNFWHIENDRGKSFAKAWQDPVIMNRVREWGLKGMSQLWLSWVRRAVFMAAGLPNSSFYRPHLAKQIVEMHGKSQGRVFDPCAGWGGRMIGSVAAGWHYTACDPNIETFQNITKIKNFIAADASVSLHNMPAEDFDFESLEPVDVVLTSPPYFNLEIYNSDPNQCYSAFQDYAAWRDQWLLPLISRTWTRLNPDGISAWNVMNFRKNDFAGDVIDFHLKHGWKLIGTVGFDSPLKNIRKLRNRDVTYVFRRSDHESESLFEFH